MKLILTLTISLCALNNALTQQINQGNFADYLMVESRFNKKGSDLQGSPYLSDNWAPGTVVFKNDYKLDKVLLRLNVFENLLEIDFKNVEYAAKASDLKEFSLIDPTIQKNVVFRKVTLKDDENVLVQIIVEGKALTGVVNKMRRARGVSSGSGAEVLNPTKDRILLYKEYYFFKGEVINQFSLSKKSFLKAIPDHVNEVEAYLKANDLHIKSEEDIAKAVTFYNSLQ